MTQENFQKTILFTFGAFLFIGAIGVVAFLVLRTQNNPPLMGNIDLASLPINTAPELITDAINLDPGIHTAADDSNKQLATSTIESELNIQLQLTNRINQYYEAQIAENCEQVKQFVVIPTDPVSKKTYDFLFAENLQANTLPLCLLFQSNSRKVGTTKFNVESIKKSDLVYSAYIVNISEERQLSRAPSGPDTIDKTDLDIEQIWQLSNGQFKLLSYQSLETTRPTNPQDKLNAYQN